MMDFDTELWQERFVRRWTIRLRIHFADPGALDHLLA